MQAGVVVKLYKGCTFVVNGTLIARGTQDKRVVFTSNNRSEKWSYLSLSSSSIVQHIVIENSTGGLRIDGTSPIVQRSVFKNNSVGIHILGQSFAPIEYNDLFQNDYAIYIAPTTSVCPDPKIEKNSMFNNTKYNVYADGIYNHATKKINASLNWWGSENPQAIENTIYDHKDNANSPVVSYSPFLSDPPTNKLNIDEVCVSGRVFDPQKNEKCSIAYTLNRPGLVTIRIKDYQKNDVVRVLVDAEPRMVGRQEERWDGRNDLNQIAAPGLYIFTIEATHPESGTGYYDPLFVPGTVAINNGSVTPVNFDPYKGEKATVKYDLHVPAMVTLKVGIINMPTPDRILIDNRPRDVLNNIETWDGRDDDGKIVKSGTYHVYGWTNLLPENALVVRYGDPLSVEYVKADPYAFRPKHGEWITITYEISQSATVTIEILDPEMNVVRTLLPETAKGTGKQTIEWDGKDDTGLTVSDGGNYTIRVRAKEATTNVVVERKGNVVVFE